MFHTFQAATSSGSGSGSASASRNNARSRRQSSTTHACEECRRRKIRCDGKLPCSHCEWYKHPKLCRYSKKQPRVVPSQRLLEELSVTVRQSQKILEQLFPNFDLTQLEELPRSDLVDLINSTSAQSPSSVSTSSPRIANSQKSTRSKSEEASSSLEVLEQEPSPEANWDESKLGPGGIPRIADDVNALSMSVNQHTSYLGVSSIAAALRVISKVNGTMERVIVGGSSQAASASGGSSPRRDSILEEYSTVRAPVLSEAALVDAYFDHVHPFIPMIDETRFRSSLADARKDAPWLALLNMVCALGTLAASTAEENSHIFYYQRAKQCVDLEMFGNGNIETVQALGLMGGFYLHYESRPNMANAIMGAAMRMACALGLHREYTEGRMESRPDFVKRAMLIPRESRRRTWWSLFCLDTWATTTQGRPSLGRFSSAVTVLPPAFLGDPPDWSQPGALSEQDALVLILGHEVSFCRIATRIQDRLAEQPLLPFEETASFDAELKQWHENLPPMFRPHQPCPQRAITPRAVMSWRYHNLRLVLHRPLLLNNALRSSLDHGDVPSEEESRLVAACRRIAAENIADIELQWHATQMSGWNAVWLLFQATMVPLVTLFAEFNRGKYDQVRWAQGQVEQAIVLLEQMADWSVTAKKTKHFLVKMYEHSRAMMMQAEQQAASHARELHEQMNSFANLGVHEGNNYDASHSTGEPGSNSTLTNYGPNMHAQAGMYGTDTSEAMYSHNVPSSAALVEGLSETSAMGMQPNVGIGPQDGLAGEDGASAVHQSGFMNQEELNAFWQQLVWGEGDFPEFMEDESSDKYDSMSYPLVTSAVSNGGYAAYST